MGIIMLSHTNKYHRVLLMNLLLSKYLFSSKDKQILTNLEP